MADAWFVDVDGAGDASQVSAAIARILSLPDPRFTGSRYELTLPNGDLVYAEDDDPDADDGYPVSIDVYGRSGDSVEDNARWLYQTLLDKTDWRLQLFDDGAAELAASI